MTLRAIAVTLAAVLCASAAERPTLLPAVGYLKPYLDETGAAAIGAALQVPITSRLAVRPEYVQSRQRFYGQRFFVASALWYLAPRESRVAWYLVGGPCVFRREERLIGYHSYQEGLMFGRGLHWRLGKGWIGGPEFRVGSAAIPMLTFSIGRRLGPA